MTAARRHAIFARQLEDKLQEKPIKRPFEQNQENTSRRDEFSSRNGMR